MSARTLSRLFRRETGTSIDAVAVRSGFAGARRMRRAFRRALGSAPREIASRPPQRPSP